MIGDLADNRKDVGRFVTETRQTAAASAERRAEIAASLQRLPTFLRELAPDDGQARRRPTDAQTPALRRPQRLRRPARDAVRARSPDFADASRTGFKSLGRAAPRRAGRRVQRRAADGRRARPGVAKHAPELANNLAIVLEHLDDRKRAVEKDPRSPGGKGYTGFEALLQYVFDQSQAINIFDANGYMLKVDLFVVAVLGLPEPPVAQGEAARRTRLLLALRRDPRPEPAGHHAGLTRATPARQVAAAQARRAAAKSKKKTDQPSAGAAGRPTCRRCRRSTEHARKKPNERQAQGREAQGAARGHARHPAARPAATPPGCRSCPAPAATARALPTSRGSSTSCSAP